MESLIQYLHTYVDHAGYIMSVLKYRTDKYSCHMKKVDEFLHSVCLQCPTTIVPFFGDQPFWGERVHEKGVGPAPIPVNHFSLEKLISAIEFMLDPQVNAPHAHGDQLRKYNAFQFFGLVLDTLL